jgi:hypothetical protein
MNDVAPRREQACKYATHSVMKQDATAWLAAAGSGQAWTLHHPAHGRRFPAVLAVSRSEARNIKAGHGEAASPLLHAAADVRNHGAGLNRAAARGGEAAGGHGSELYTVSRHQPLQRQVKGAVHAVLQKRPAPPSHCHNLKLILTSALVPNPTKNGCTSLASPAHLTKSASFFPEARCAALHSSTSSCRKSATFSKSEEQGLDDGTKNRRNRLVKGGAVKAASARRCREGARQAGTAAARRGAVRQVGKTQGAEQLATECGEWGSPASFRPREVMAGVPMRTPPGVSADTSPTTAFLLRVMWQRSQAFSTLLPVRPSGRRSHSTRWLSGKKERKRVHQYCCYRSGVERRS